MAITEQKVPSNRIGNVILRDLKADESQACSRQKKPEAGFA